MTDRRRFFPAASAQSVPGSTANMLVQLQPLAAAPPAASFEADIAGPALLPEWRYMIGATRKKVPFPGYEDYMEDQYEGLYWQWEEVEEESIAHGSGYELPAAAYSADGRMTRCWVGLGGFKRPLRFRAVLLGRAMSDVRWTAELDTSMPWPQRWRRTLGELWPAGVDVEDEGHSLLIRVHPGTTPQNPGNWAATLTMSASAGGKPAGQLELRLGWRVKPLAEELQPAPYDFAGWDGWKPSDTEE